MPAENIHQTPQPPDQGHEADIPPTTPGLIVHESMIPEVDDPRYHAITQIVKKTFPELEGMDAGEVAKTLYPVLWDIVDPENTVSKAKKDAIEDWSAGVFPQVLEQGSLREASDVADVLAQGNPHLHEERRSVKDEARTDAQTGLGNARAFDEFKTALNSDPERLKGKAVCYVDLNGLKDANTAFGIPVGDYLIKLSGESLRNGSKQLFADVERKKGEGAQIFRISEGADDYVAFVPIDHVDEFAQYITQTFGHLNGEEKDYQELDSKGDPQVLTPPEGIRVSSGTEVNGRKVVGYVGLSGTHRETGEPTSVNSSLSVGIVKPESVEDLAVENMVKKAFDEMNKDKDFIKITFPNLASR